MSIITTGIKNAPVVCRLELRTFVQDKDVFNLYVLAIDKMQKIDQKDPSSWFQLAGIHGRYVSNPRRLCLPLTIGAGPISPGTMWARRAPSLGIAATRPSSSLAGT